MVNIPRCLERQCRHLAGVKDAPGANADIIGANQVWHCPAFPDGIPEDITDQDNLHMEPDPRQEDGTEAVVYERTEAR
jgi:hypothetical protein